MRQKIPPDSSNYCTTENVDRQHNSNNFSKSIFRIKHFIQYPHKLNVNYALLLHWVEYYWSSRQKPQILPKANCQNLLSPLSFGSHPKNQNPLSVAELPLSFVSDPLSFGECSPTFDHCLLAFDQPPLALGQTVEIRMLGSGCSEDCLGPWWRGWLRCLQENRVFWSWVFWLGPCIDKVRSSFHEIVPW